MARGDFKADPRIIIREHRRTYASARTAQPRRRDRLMFEGLPVVVFGLCMYFDVQLSSGASAGLLTVSGVLSVFLFGVMVQLWARAMDLADAQPEPSPATSQQANSLEELAANAAYAVLVCIAAAVVFVVASIGTSWVLRVSSALGLAVGVHLILVLLMVIKRVFAQTQERLVRARTGADREEKPARRRAS
jgi:hypothetical protein